MGRSWLSETALQAILRVTEGTIGWFWAERGFRKHQGLYGELDMAAIKGPSL